ncbi:MULTISPECIES: hypothetical protein [unclassified Pseudomonas]
MPIDPRQHPAFAPLADLKNLIRLEHSAGLFVGQVPLGARSPEEPA